MAEHSGTSPHSSPTNDPPDPGPGTNPPMVSDRRNALLTIVVIALAAVAGLFVAMRAGAGEGGAAPPTPAAAVDGVQTFEVTDQSHVETPVDYPQTPPVGGPHASAWMNCGFYPEPVPNENAVHSLEHGAVWISYRSDIVGSDELAALRKLATANPYVLVTPHPEIDVPVALSAWGTQLRLDTFNEGQVNEFVAAFAQGPQTPEPGAPCTGGIGQPSS